MWIGDEVNGREVPEGKDRLHGLGREDGHRGLVGQAAQLRVEKGKMRWKGWEGKNIFF